MATAPVLNKTTEGTVAQVIGAVVDVAFESDLPAILTALETDNAVRMPRREAIFALLFATEDRRPESHANRRAHRTR